MAKKLSAKIGEYQKDGQTKGRYVNVGVIMQSNDGGEFVLFDPSVSLAGILQQQNILAQQQGKETRDRVMCSVFEEQQQGGYQQQSQQQYQQPHHQAPSQQPVQTPPGYDPNRAQGASHPQPPIDDSHILF